MPRRASVPILTNRPKCFARVFAAHVDPSDPPHRGAATAANNLSEPSGAIFVRDAPERGGLPLELEMLAPSETEEGFAHGNATVFLVRPCFNHHSDQALTTIAALPQPLLQL